MHSLTFPRLRREIFIDLNYEYSDAWLQRPDVRVAIHTLIDSSERRSGVVVASHMHRLRLKQKRRRNRYALVVMGDTPLISCPKETDTHRRCFRVPLWSATRVVARIRSEAGAAQTGAVSQERCERCVPRTYVDHVNPYDATRAPSSPPPEGST